jgi:hypothetical protein
MITRFYLLSQSDSLIKSENMVLLLINFEKSSAVEDHVVIKLRPTVSLY